MKVLFVVGQLNFAEPMGLMQMSAIVRQEGHEVCLAVLRTDDVVDVAVTFRPDIVFFSTMTPESIQCLESARMIKEQLPVPIVMGGAHPTFYHAVVDEECLDAICVGEGEEAIVEIIDAVAKGTGFKGLANVLTSSQDELILRPLVQDLDSVPFIDREIIYERESFKHYPIRSFMTGRGCVYNCAYCFNAGYKKLYRGKGKIFRRRSVDSLMKEMKEVCGKWQTDFIRFSDDTFIFRIDDWSEEFLDRYKKEIGLPFYCLLRADTVTEKLAGRLKDAGCYTVCMSIESADDEIRTQVLKRKVSKKQIREAFDIFRNLGVMTKTSCMYSLPGTTIEQDIATLEFASDCRVTVPMFNTFMPYPGTELGQSCIDTGEYDGDLNRVISFQRLSPLSGFDQKDKVRRHNLMLLSTFLCKFRFIRGKFLRMLLNVKPNPLYYAINFLLLGYLNGKAFQHSFFSRSAWSSLKSFIGYYGAIRQKNN